MHGKFTMQKMIIMSVKRNYRVSDDFDKKLQYMQSYLRDELGLDYTQSEILDEMMELYMARMIMNENIIQSMFKETIEAAMQQLLISNAEMLNGVFEEVMK